MSTRGRGEGRDHGVHGRRWDTHTLVMSSPHRIFLLLLTLLAPRYCKCARYRCPLNVLPSHPVCLAVSKSLGRPGQASFLLSPFYGSNVPAYASVLAWHIAWHQKVSRGTCSTAALAMERGRLVLAFSDMLAVALPCPTRSTRTSPPLPFLAFSRLCPLQYGVQVHILYVTRQLTELLASPMIQVNDSIQCGWEVHVEAGVAWGGGEVHAQ